MSKFSELQEAEISCTFMVICREGMLFTNPVIVMHPCIHASMTWGQPYGKECSLALLHPPPSHVMKPGTY